eukprot:CAMPEP_0119113652 /NCGR_PEP_ID=MMETSP1180-20130426/44755_1 /TAXON_ID=3052 ORGANISM="Chlamydomonas cf sp, Strain CCMP681" /NCGR_SAMPLE_ID=MMETSP1180 /ASSEMBLY_ACC=CAM_ASM_000741 /LENGTH=73 /DNA_ID=CAMNT_0007101851 /DNA_START=233 /DNA_END=450 /DNA_ORIENTATION=+
MVTDIVSCTGGFSQTRSLLAHHHFWRKKGGLPRWHAIGRLNLLLCQVCLSAAGGGGGNLDSDAFCRGGLGAVR